MPAITVLLPVYNSVFFLERAIKSIVDQTFTDWEMLIINEYGSDDGSFDIAEKYAAKDSRIKVIQNSEKLGLAASLNKGIRHSDSEFIARMDADDTSCPERFEKQIELMRKTPQIGICGGWQRHIRGRKKWLHCPPTDPNELKASLLFTCEMCHSTIMMRSEVIKQHELYYDEKFFAEDYELWTRAILVTELANIPEILGDYHVGDTITQKKQSELELEHGKICAMLLKRVFDIEIQNDETYLLNAWRNIFRHEKGKREKKNMLTQYQHILCEIEKANKKVLFVPESVLLPVLRKRWVWAKWDIRMQHTGTVNNMEQVFDKIRCPQLRWVISKFI